MSRDPELAAIQKLCRVLDGFPVPVRARLVEFIVGRTREQIALHQNDQAKQAPPVPKGTS